MVSPANLKEAERATLVFQTATTSMGLRAFKDANTLWQDVPPVPGVRSSSSAGKWLALAAAYIASRRGVAQALAIAYYRYMRALLTGSTVALAGGGASTLGGLQSDFHALAGAQLPGGIQQASQDALSDPEVLSKPVPVDPIDNLKSSLDGIEAEAKTQAQSNLYSLGPQNLDFKINGIRFDNVKSLDDARKTAHQEAGNRQAATVQRQVLNGARAPLYLIASRDKNALGWVRASRTGTPCGFCAMLISRGVVYRSADTAGDFDKYHDNCNCYAIPVFTMQQYESDALFALNRKYSQLWPQVTKGLGGDAAITKWRRFIRDEAKSQKSPVAAA